MARWRSFDFARFAQDDSFPSLVGSSRRRFVGIRHLLRHPSREPEPMTLASRCSVATLILALSLGAGISAQQLPGDRAPRRISERPQEFPETFTSVRSLTALPDGRLVMSDASEKKLFLLDFAKGNATPISRTGTGPREYQDPGGTYRAAKGGVVLYDQRQRRFLPITPSGQLQDVVALPMTPTSWGASDEGPDSFVPDSLGNLYTEGERRFNGVAQDSIPLLRIDKRGVVSDTVGYLRQPERKSLPSSQPGVSMSQMVVFSPQDVWAVAADGAVAVVKTQPYRVDWFTPGTKVVRGAPIGFTPLRSTRADRDSIAAIGGRGSAPRIGRNGQSQAIPMPKTEPLMRESKPAFGRQVPRIDERGRLWVERSKAADAVSRVYDIFDRRGQLFDRVELPAGSRLVGFDATSIYTVRKDDDDLLHLQRFRMP